MNLSARTLLVTATAAALGLAAAVGATLGTRRPAGPVVLPAADARRADDAGPAKRVPVGMAGCMAAACHGAPAEAVLTGSADKGEYWPASGSGWAAADPHTAAYSLLTDQPRHPVKVTAAQIMAKYRPAEGGRPPAKATEDARCLACHTNPALASDGPAPAEVVALREQGVSCEACHGNAGQWLQPHTAWTKAGDRTGPYRETGLVPLFDLGERALNCAACHVGAPAADGLPVRDMNHDMIAAGHPRLDFDFAEYQRRLPRHWQEKDRVGIKPGERPRPRETNEAQVWYVGRVAHAEAACRLLEDRARRAGADDPRSPWPEFAEFNCAACHHNLRVPTTAHEGSGPLRESDDWRKDDAHLSGRPLGSTPWQTIWPLTHASGLPKPARAESDLSAVVRLMDGEDGGERAAGPVRYAAAEKAQQVAAATADGWRSCGGRRRATVPDPAVAEQAASFFPAGRAAWSRMGQRRPDVLRARGAGVRPRVAG
jgi:hypothetical protein